MALKQTTLSLSRSTRSSLQVPLLIECAPLVKQENVTAAARRSRRSRETYEIKYDEIPPEPQPQDEMLRGEEEGESSVNERREKEGSPISDIIAPDQSSSKRKGKIEREKPVEGDRKVVRSRKLKRRRVDDSDAEEEKEEKEKGKMETMVQVVDGHDVKRDSSATDSTTMLSSKTYGPKTCIPNSEDEGMEFCGESELVEEKQPASSHGPLLSSRHSAIFQEKMDYSPSSSQQTSPRGCNRRRSVKDTSLTERSTPLTPTSTFQPPCLRISLVGCNKIYAVPISEVPSPMDTQSKLTKLFNQPPDACIQLTDDRGDIIHKIFWNEGIWRDGYRMRIEFTRMESGCHNLSATGASYDATPEDIAKVVMVDAAVLTEEVETHEIGWSKMREEAIEADVRAKWKEKEKEMELQFRERENAMMQKLREREKEHLNDRDLDLFPLSQSQGHAPYKKFSSNASNSLNYL